MNTAGRPHKYPSRVSPILTLLKVIYTLAFTLLIGLLYPCQAVADPGGWYAKPQVNIRALRVNSQSVIQATLGAEGGLRYPISDGFMGRTRLGAVGLYGISSGSLGGDFRLGSFIGPAGRMGFVQIGPDFWFNGYGRKTATDYRLPWSPGLSIPAIASMALHPSIRAVTSVTPGWAFSQGRRGGGLGPFDEFSLVGAAVITAGTGHLTLGYQHSWNRAGTIQGLLLSGGL